MSLEKGKGKREKAKSGLPSSSSARNRRASPGDVGAALRSAYQRTIDEDIPPEMLDLLGRLT